MKKKIIYLLSGTLIVIIALIVIFYSFIFGISVIPHAGGSTLYLPSGSTYSQVLDTLQSGLSIKKPELLDWLAKKKKYPERIKPGRYIIKQPVSINELVNILRSGRQSPVRVTFNNIRTLNQLAGKFGRQLEVDSLRIMDFLADESNYASNGFRKETIISVFIPDTYEFYWNTDAEGVYQRMLKEYNRFWNTEREAKAKELGLTKTEVSILASIIDDEVTKKEDKPKIAGVYLNRLKRGIPLQACPTIKFAMNDFTITRVLKVHLQTDSPYNTYRYRGFPPGPIGCPSVEGLDAVLNAAKHDYLYFAAKADFSGYHNFSRTLSEHNRYAAEYQRELNRRKIYR